MMRPSCVVFFFRRRKDVCDVRRLDGVRNGGGSDERDGRAGMLDSPSGSFLADSRESRITEPGGVVSLRGYEAERGRTGYFVGGLLIEHADTPLPAFGAALLEPVVLRVCHLEAYTRILGQAGASGSSAKWSFERAVKAPRRRCKGASKKRTLAGQDAGRRRIWVNTRHGC